MKKPKLGRPFESNLRDRFKIACLESDSWQEAGRKINISRQRAHQLAKELGMTIERRLVVSR